MSVEFNPYHKWLAIPPDEQPANHYRLLGTAPFESDPDVIEGAADQRMAHLRSFQNGRHGDHVQRLLNEIAAAKVCLLNPEERAAYDRELKQRLAAAQPQPAAVPTGKRGASPVVVTDARSRSVSATAHAKRQAGSKMPLLIGGLIGAVVVVLLLIFLLPGGDDSPVTGDPIAANKPVVAPPQRPVPVANPPATKPVPSPTPAPPALPAVLPEVAKVDPPTVPATTPVAPAVSETGSETSAADPSGRQSLLRILAEHGTVTLQLASGGKRVTKVEELPQEYVSVVYVDLAQSLRNDTGMAALGALPGLRGFRCFGGTVTDAGLAQLSEQSDLIGADLSHNKQITDAGLIQLGKINSLEQLHLYGGNLTDQGLASLQSLTRLKGLNLSDASQLTGAGFAHLNGLKSLETIGVNGSSMQDAALEHLIEFPHLKSLGLIATQITDAGLSHLARLPELRKLDLRKTQVTDAGVATLQQALPMCEILHGN